MLLSPTNVVERYVLEIYNAKNVELVHELCADPVIRHEPGSPGCLTSLTRAEQVERIRADLDRHQPQFEIVALAGDDRFASLTWQAARLADNSRLCGIEVFGVHEGLITDVWNAPYAEGAWR